MWRACSIPSGLAIPLVILWLAWMAAVAAFEHCRWTWVVCRDRRVLAGAFGIAGILYPPVGIGHGIAIAMWKAKQKRLAPRRPTSRELYEPLVVA